MCQDQDRDSNPQDQDQDFHCQDQDLKKVPRGLTSLVCLCEKGGSGWSAEGSGRNESARRKRKAGWSKKTWRNTAKQKLEISGMDEKMIMNQRRWRKIIAIQGSNLIGKI